MDDPSYYSGSSYTLPFIIPKLHVGSSSIESVIIQCKLNFINSIVTLDNNSLPNKLLIKRIQYPLVKGLIPDLQTMLDHLNLPSINFPLDNLIKPASWKRSIKKQLGVRAYLKFLEDCQDCIILASVTPKLGNPCHMHWSVVVGDVQCTCASYQL